MHPHDGLRPRGTILRHPPIRVEEEMKQMIDTVLIDTVLIDIVPIDTVLIDTVQSDEVAISEAAEAIIPRSPYTVVGREGIEADPGPNTENQPTKQHLSRWHQK